MSNVNESKYDMTFYEITSGTKYFQTYFQTTKDEKYAFACYKFVCEEYKQAILKLVIIKNNSINHEILSEYELP